MRTSLNSFLFCCVGTILLMPCDTGLLAKDSIIAANLAKPVSISAGDPASTVSIFVGCPSGTVLRHSKEGNSQSSFSCTNPSTHQLVFSGNANYPGVAAKFEETNSSEMHAQVICAKGESADINTFTSLTNQEITVSCSPESGIALEYSVPSIKRCSRLTNSSRSQQYIVCSY